MHLILSSMLAMGTFNPIRFAVGFIVTVVVLAIVIILVKWLLGLAGIAIPPPLMYVLGLVVFLILFLCLIDWAGLYSFNFGG